MTTTGKSARKRYGTRFAAKRAKARRNTDHKKFGKLPVSANSGNAVGFDSEALMARAAKDHAWVRLGLCSPARGGQ